MALSQAADSAPTSSLDTIKTVVDIVGTSVTAIAVIVGAIWAYFKFVKGRTFRPRLGLAVSAEWQKIGPQDLLHLRATLKNLGASKIVILQAGTGLQVSDLDLSRPENPPAWNARGTFSIFEEHQWIEPAETISDEILVDPGSMPGLIQVVGRIVCQRTTYDNITVVVRRVFTPDSKLDKQTS